MSEEPGRTEPTTPLDIDDVTAPSEADGLDQADDPDVAATREQPRHDEPAPRATDRPPYPGPLSEGEQLSGRHAVIVSQLVMGLVFLGLALVWALHASGVVDAGGDWVLPLLLVVAGGAGLVATLARGTSR